MTRRRNMEQQQRWRRVIREQEASSLGISAFCREHEVPPSSFFYWRRKLKKQQRENISAPKDVAAGDNHNHKSSAAKFVPLTLQTPTATTLANAEVVLPHGCRVIVPTGCDPRWLREILGAIKEAAC